MSHPPTLSCSQKLYTVKWHMSSEKLLMFRSMQCCTVYPLSTSFCDPKSVLPVPGQVRATPSPETSVCTQDNGNSHHKEKISTATGNLAQQEQSILRNKIWSCSFVGRVLQSYSCSTSFIDSVNRS